MSVKKYPYICKAFYSHSTDIKYNYCRNKKVKRIENLEKKINDSIEKISKNFSSFFLKFSMYSKGSRGNKNYNPGHAFIMFFNYNKNKHKWDTIIYQSYMYEYQPRIKILKPLSKDQFKKFIHNLFNFIKIIKTNKKTIGNIGSKFLNTLTDLPKGHHPYTFNFNGFYIEFFQSQRIKDQFNFNNIINCIKENVKAIDDSININITKNQIKNELKEDIKITKKISKNDKFLKLILDNKNLIKKLKKKYNFITLESNLDNCKDKLKKQEQQFNRMDKHWNEDKAYMDKLYSKNLTNLNNEIFRLQEKLKKCSNG